MIENLGVVIVTYNPNKNDFISNLNHYSKVASKIVVVDNSEKPELKEILNNFDNVEYIVFKDNLGIAKAQNVGIGRLFEFESIKYILFFDQDSYLEVHGIEKLYSSLNEFLKNNDVGLIAPNDEVVNTKGRYSIKKEVISSGSMIPVKSLKNIGLMREELFIDFVDYEWCWRANRKKYLIICDNEVHLVHQTDKPKVILGKTVSKPFRNYYYYRNIIFLLLNNLTIWPKRMAFFKMFKHTVFELIFCENRKQRYVYIVSGIKAVLNKDMGRLD